MILAVPSRHGVPFNHFAKAPSFSVIDSNTQQLQAEFHLELDPSKSCGKKSAILHQLRHYQVEAVAVRQIGQSMLQALFNAGISVYALPRGSCFNRSCINTVTANHGFKLWQSLTK